MYEMGAMLKKYIDGGMLENGTNASGYKTTVLGGQYTSDSPYGDVRRRTVSEGNLNTFRLQREFDDRLEYFMDKYPSMNIEDARQEVMKQMAQDNGFMSRIDLIETARRGRPSDTQAGKRLMMEDGGIMKYPGGGLMPKQYEEGGELDPEKLRKLARSLSVLGSDDRMRENVSATTGGPEGNLSLDVAMNVPEGIESLSMPSPEPEERMDLQRVDVRGPRVIRSNRRNKSIQGGRREVPEMPAKEDYRFIPLRDPAGGGITTVRSGQKSDPSGMMGVRVGNTYYYMPNARGYTGPRGKNVRDFREIRDRFGEDAYMEALGMLQEGGADISQFVD